MNFYCASVLVALLVQLGKCLFNLLLLPFIKKKKKTFSLQDSKHLWFFSFVNIVQATVKV